MLNIVGHKRIYFTVSLVLVIASATAILSFGFREGIDFSGGTLWQFSIAKDAPSFSDLEATLKETLSFPEIRVNREANGGSFLARFPVVSSEDHEKHLAALKAKYPTLEELSYSAIGPSVGAELRKKALIAIVLVLVGISLYIAYAFRRASYPVSSWKYGWVTLLTLFHDVLIPAGLLAYLGHARGVEIDGNFVVALLVVMGFSVHDRIVVFDRIRENVVLHRQKEAYGTIVNQSINQTLARSINTSLTLILVLLALLFVGPEALRYFVLTLLIGVTVGIYSSICVASPLLVVLKGREKRT